MSKRNNSITYKNENININKELNNYSEVIPFKYINSEEKYFNNKIIDTKNWLYKKGFINNMGKYNGNNNYFFIENYVGATPNIPLFLHQFRDVSKNQWINQRGFYPLYFLIIYNILNLNYFILSYKKFIKNSILL